MTIIFVHLFIRSGIRKSCHNDNEYHMTDTLSIILFSVVGTCMQDPNPNPPDSIAFERAGLSSFPLESGGQRASLHGSSLDRPQRDARGRSGG